MVSFGRSDPLTLVNGSAEARVLVSDVNDFAWFNNLETAVFSGAMASDGGGRFYLFGGNTSGAEGTRPSVKARRAARVSTG